MKAGFVGLGAMGEPMARNLAQAGYLHTVYSRTRAKAERVADELRVRVAHSPEDLARQCEIVISCVPADAEVLELAAALRAGMRSGAVLVDSSTIAIATARRVGDDLRSVGAAFLDAPVTGGVEGARHATLTMLVGGDPAVLDRVRPVLGAMAARIIHFGDVGCGQAAKAVNQVMAAGINQAVTEALAFGAALDLDMNRLIDAVGGGAAGNWFLDKRGRTMVQGSFPPGFRVTLHHKDLVICQDIADDIGAVLPLAAKTREDYRMLMEQGHGDEDISALYRLKRGS